MRVFIQFDRKPLLFENAETIVRCDDPVRLVDAFAEMERLNKAGFYLAGFLSYEAGYALEPHFRETGRSRFPLLLMGAYRKPVCRMIKSDKGSSFDLTNLRRNISRDEYARDIEKIRDYIAAGDVYQITYCLKLRFDFKGDPLALYARLWRTQPVPYPAVIETEAFQILSLSPERFIKKEGGGVITEPMKGTWPRGDGLFSDSCARWQFSKDRKNRAENVMIADLLRNDLGRIGRDVRAPKLFTITSYKTLFQMTSTVMAEIDRDTSFQKLFSAIFPSGSVTGAPKIRAMEIIQEIEHEPRGIYTGAIGYIAPNRDLYFNVPIRTVHIQDGLAEMGIGGGIIWDSTADGEWAEGILKARFITDVSG